ncbi:MAG: putative repeat protein (TIGR01451 family) [Flavobacteriaceae bacterium]|jgi:uncharacterized repeat protein (TIGR01451 family)
MKTTLTQLLLLFCCILFFNSESIAQSALRIEITNPADVPLIEDDNGILRLEFSNPLVQAVFDNYTVTMFLKEFPMFQEEPALKNIYYVEDDGTGGLFTDLSALNYFPLVESVGLGEVLATPTDYIAVPSLEHINVPQAWQITESTPGVKLGQVDLWLRDPSLNAQTDLDGSIEIGTGLNFTGATHSHAYGVGRTIAAQPNNGICGPYAYCAGVGYDSRLYVGYGSFTLNIQEQIARGVRVVNISMTSGCTYSTTEQLFYDKVAEKGVIIVVAAGNGTIAAANHSWVGGGCSTALFNDIACNPNYTGNSNGYLYPASYDNVISVTGNSNLTDHILWGNTGYDCDAVPGNETFYDKLLTVNDQVDVISPSSAAIGTEFGTTSFCAPIVTGAIGLMLSVNPNLDVNECIEIFNLTGVNVISAGTNANYFQTALLEQDRLRTEVRRIDVEAAVIEAKSRYDAYLLVQNAQPTQFDRILTGSHVTDGMGSFELNWIDYDNDLDLDIFNGTNAPTPQDPMAEFHMYENMCGDLSDFVNVSMPGFETNNLRSRNIGWGDFNNDGTKDYIAINELNELTFYENTGNLSFVPSLIAALPPGLLRKGSVADFDANGDLDFVFGNILATTNPNNVHVYEGNGDGTFTLVTGNTTDIYVDAISFGTSTTGDINEDGFQDIAIAGGVGAEKLRLYLGDGEFGFQKAVLDLDLTNVSPLAYGVTMVDYDNDTDLDLYFFGYPHGVLYNNLNNGKYFHVDNLLIATDPTVPNSNVTWGDYDNDGDQDVYVPSLQTKTLYNNERGIIFSNASNEFPSLGTETDHETGNAAFADADNDGDLDLYVSNFFNNDMNNYLYENLGNSNNWIKLKLAGSHQDYGFTVAGTSGDPRMTALSAEGAKIIATMTSFTNAAGEVGCTQVRHIQTSDGSPHDVHFGFGEHTGVVTIRIQWPSGHEDVFILPVNECYQITEGDLNYTTGCACSADLPGEHEISGTVGYDVNQDCNCDDNGDGFVDYPLDNFFVQIEESLGDVYFAQTQPNGDYTMGVPAGTYTITPYLTGTTFEVSDDCPGNPNLPPVQYSPIVVPPNSDDNDFCLTSNNCDLEISLYPNYTYPASAPCPSITQDYCMTISNNGMTTDNPIFTLDLDQNLMIGSAFSACGSTLIDPVTNTITLNYTGSFGPGQTCTVCATVTIDAGTLNSNLSTSASVGGTCQEETEITEFVNCAIDPNDKLLVNPRSCGPENNIERNEVLTYRIHFQNEGNAPAVNVVVKDLLDDDLDLSTLQLLASSHTVDKVSVLPGNKLILELNDIQLPPLSVDLAGSQGYIMFRIKAKPGVIEGTIIDNVAAIYFDLNEAVVTNTVMNTLREYPQPDVQFEWNRSCASLDISYDFSYTGVTPDGASYIWNFGPNATPSSSTSPSPTNIVFSTAGTEQVSLQILRYGCDDILIQNVDAISPIGCNGNPNKVAICHNGNSLCVNINALQAHLNHGDCLGECPPDITSNEKGVQVYPNPSTGIFNVISVESIIREYHVVNMLGEIVKEGAGNQSGFSFDLKQLQSGLYLLVIVTDEGTITRRIEKL